MILLKLNRIKENISEEFPKLISEGKVYTFYDFFLTYMLFKSIFKNFQTFAVF